MDVIPYKEKKYTQSDSVTQAQQALQDHQANKPGAYQSKYQAGMNNLMGQIQNRPSFQYDVNSDALYQQVAQNYMLQGQQAMMDTMGQAAALTGGYGNSYAQTAGQQTYNQYLMGLSELVPQYYQMALDRYQMEGDQLLDKYALLAQQEDSDYAKYLDNLNRYYTDLDRKQTAYDSERSFDYGKYMDDLNYQYQLGRDQIADEQWQKEFDENMRRYNQEWEAEHPVVDPAASAADSGGGNGPSSPQVSEDDKEAMDFVERMLDNATSSQFDPNRVISGSSLTDAQKETAQEYLYKLTNKGYTK